MIAIIDAIETELSETVLASRVKRAAKFVDWFLRSGYFNSMRFGSSSDMWIDDPERAERVSEAAEHGCNGSTHYEEIKDMRDAFEYWLRDTRKNTWTSHDRFEDAVYAHFDRIEAYHKAQGTLHQEVG